MVTGKFRYVFNRSTKNKFFYVAKEPNGFTDNFYVNKQPDDPAIPPLFVDIEVSLPDPNEVV